MTNTATNQAEMLPGDAWVFANTGYTVEQLDAAFKRVQNRDHWKNAIDCMIPQEDFDIISRAVVFYTATELRIAQQFDNGWMRVQADGYRSGPAGDH